ncbi:MAG: hypothetical protein PHX72_01515 [Candidatus Shapirobacteria bacterium]|nr:hypothetical protein [Candidatus Shapirobacteria bacterium]
MIKNGFAYLILGENNLRLKKIQTSNQRFVVFKLETSSQQIGFNTALIFFKNIKVQCLLLTEKSEILSHEQLFLSKALDEFGVVGKIHQNTITSSEGMAPLFLIALNNKTIYTYSLLLSNTGEMLFLNSGKKKIDKNRLNIKNIGNYINLAINNHHKYRYQLNNYIGLYFKSSPDIEYEYKLNLPNTTDIWQIQQYFVRSLRQGKIPGYALNLLRGITRWTFENYLFEIVAPKKERGYISFIRTPNNNYIIKHKIYNKDRLKRIELRTRDVKIRGSFEDYLKEKYPGFLFKEYPMFIRQFYGFVMDSLDSGNNFGFTVDRNYIKGSNYPNLIQLEIEYYNSLKLTGPNNFYKELAQVTDIYKKHLTLLNIPFESTFYSKLSYLKDCARNKKCPTRIFSS